MDTTMVKSRGFRYTGLTLIMIYCHQGTEAIEAPRDMFQYHITGTCPSISSIHNRDPKVGQGSMNQKIQTLRICAMVVATGHVAKPSCKTRVSIVAVFSEAGNITVIISNFCFPCLVQKTLD